jgi:iron complex transport system substrate-binding protein
VVANLEAISVDVVDQALQLHRGLGRGLLESVYETVLAGKLASLGVFGGPSKADRYRI